MVLRSKGNWEDWLTYWEKVELREIEDTLEKHRAITQEASKKKTRLCSLAATRRWQTENREEYLQALKKYQEKRSKRTKTVGG